MTHTNQQGMVRRGNRKKKSKKELLELKKVLKANKKV